MKKDYTQFGIFINGQKGYLDVALLSDGSYECLFGQEDFTGQEKWINSFSATGFIVKESMEGIREVQDFVSLNIGEKNKLTTKYMREMWDQIPKEKLS